ncbi:MAG: enoyl-CoA hydratase/isomerase family protein, partial [Deltaproteobacteria bacterium]
MADNFEHLLVTEREAGIAQLTVNRPGKLNALNLEVLEELCLALEALDRREDVKVIILDGAGDRAFIAGADIGQMAGMSALEFRKYSMFMRKAARIMTGGEKIFIAAVQGMAFGGGNIVAMNCDFVFATTDAVFGQQEIDLGIIGGIPRLIYLIGARRALDIVMTGRTIPAPEAARIGLITRCIPKEEFEEYVLGYARAITEKSEIAVRLAKAVKKMSERVDLEAAYEYENELT